MTKISSTEEWQEAVKKHIDKLKEEERYEFAHSIIFDVALWTGYNAYEMIGLLEMVKNDMIESLRNNEDCDGDCDNCDKKEE